MKKLDVLYKMRSKRYRNAFQRGREAAKIGLLRTECPYDPKALAMVGCGKWVPTGERAYAKSWLDGWDFETKLLGDGEGM